MFSIFFRKYGAFCFSIERNYFGYSFNCSSIKEAKDRAYREIRGVISGGNYDPNKLIWCVSHENWIALSEYKKWYATGTSADSSDESDRSAKMHTEYNIKRAMRDKEGVDYYIDQNDLSKNIRHILCFNTKTGERNESHT